MPDTLKSMKIVLIHGQLLSLCVCVCVLTFITDKIPEKDNFEEERLILVHGFRGFSPWCIGSALCGPVMRQSILVQRV